MPMQGRGGRMRTCSVTSGLEVTRGGIADYDRLSGFHYRGEKLGPCAAVYVIGGKRQGVAGVIVYSMPTPGCELRNRALGDMFSGLDRRTRLRLINANIRRISRVVVEPRFRGLGLAVRLVRETMPLIDVPVIESMAVMGEVNPFFERAGMTAYRGSMPARCVQMAEAFGAIGIWREMFGDCAAVQRMLESLDGDMAGFIETQMRLFLQSYGRRKAMTPGIERTRFVLSRLSDRPVYYIWRNENCGFRLWKGSDI